VLSSTCTLIGVIMGIFAGYIDAVARYAMISYVINFFISYFMLVKMTFKFSFMNFLKSFLPDIGVALFVVAGGIISSRIVIDASNIVQITINAGIRLAVMGAAYIIGLIVLRQHKHLINVIKKK
jgi:hypothetical protein